MELLCACGQIHHTSLSDYCVCRRCGRIWKYEQTTYANDWRCIRHPSERREKLAAGLRQAGEQLHAARARVEKLSELVRDMEPWLVDEAPGHVRAAANDAIARWENEG